MHRPDAHAHDATQRPEHFDAAAREREALERIERWHGPGQWQAAMLALLLGPAEWARWIDATADLPQAVAMRDELAALRGGARRRVFALLLRRARSSPLAARRAQWHGFMQRWRRAVDTASAPQRWRLFVAHGELFVRRKATARQALAALASSAHAATPLLAMALGLSSEASTPWQRDVQARLVELGAATPRGPQGLAPPTAQQAQLLALRLRRLTPMQRPLLLRTWMQPLVPLPEPATDALHAACLWLDLPVPEAWLT